MVNEEILGGLKSAISKGDSLKIAMMSFYNSGYKKEEIEEAAKVLQSQKIEKKETPDKIPLMKKISEKIPLKKDAEKKKIPEEKLSQKVSAYGDSLKEKIVSKIPFKKSVEKKKIPEEKLSQKVSDYQEKKESKPKPKIIIFLLIFFLLALIGVLVAVFLFRNELVDFLNKIS